MKINRSISEPIRENLTWHQKWQDSDNGIIFAWELGRKEAVTDTDLAARALEGQLVMLGWKGGVERRVKVQKFGTLLYLAMWQGLRGEDLSIDTDVEVVLTCSKFGVPVTYTNDADKYAEP